MKQNVQIGLLVASSVWLAVGLTGCTDPDACESSADCFAGDYCAKGQCVPRPDVTGGGATGGSGTGSSGGSSGGTGMTGGGDGGTTGGSTTGGDTSNSELRYIDVSAGEEHSCGLLSDGRVYCWGKPDRVTEQIPTDVRFTEIESGHDLVCGRTTDEKLRCWGANEPVREDRPDLPEDISGRSFALGTFQYSVDGPQVCIQDVPQGSQVTCYIVDGGEEQDYTVGVQGSVAGIAIGESFACAASERDFQCADERKRPGGIEDFDLPAADSDIGCGWKYCCAVDRSGGGVDCHTTRSSDDEEALLAGSDGDYDRIAVGYSHVCGRSAGDGTVSCWGTTNDELAGTEEAALDGASVEAMASGMSHVCAILAKSGEIHCWSDKNDERTQAPVPAAAAVKIENL